MDACEPDHDWSDWHYGTTDTGIRWGSRYCVRSCGAKQEWAVPAMTVREPVRIPEPAPSAAAPA